MALDMTQEQKDTGKENYARTAEGLTRRGFMKSMVIAGGAIVPATAAVYFGYKALAGTPVKAALIGGGDEGGVLIGEHNPEFLEFVAVADIRPTNMKRIFDGDPKTPLRKGFKKVYGADANKIKKYADYEKMLKENPEIEAVVIALPLHLHAKAAIDAMRIGKERGKPIHVLCEKLMAWNIAQCKKMIQVAKETGSILSIGHQRHYSLLYAHANEIVKAGVLGDVKHIRALWHRNNSWPYMPDPAGPPLVKGTEPFYRDGWYPPVYQEDYDALKEQIKGYHYDSVEQLVRWRLDNMTGGGLMAELGSHQLDACSIFLGKVKPLHVSGVGGKYFYSKGHNDRDSDDHVFVTYEFPGKNHPLGLNHGSDENDLVVVTYSSINTNGFENYGECIMGTRGSMVVEQEQSVMLYTEKDPSKRQAGAARSMAVGVGSTGDKPALDSTSTWGGAAATPTGAATGPAGPVSRGYREEMEDFAYCIRLWDAMLGWKEKPESERKDKNDRYIQRLPRCHGEIAMADAIIALTANRAMREHARIAFDPKWFDAAAREVPDTGVAPKVPVE
jgi:predicted dehydrogenase